MSKKENNNAATDLVAAFQKKYDDAVLELSALPADALKEVLDEAAQKVEQAKTELEAQVFKETEAADKFAADRLAAEKLALDNASKLKGKKQKVKFLISPTGKFNLAYVEGEEAVFSEAQANELEEAGYVKFIK